MAGILIIGCGDIGNGLGGVLGAGGDTVWGLRRRVDLLAPGIRGISAEISEPASLQPLAALSPDQVLITLTPNGFDDAAYYRSYVQGLANCLPWLQSMSSLRRVWLVSSTGVYGQCDGSWVDENSATAPTGFSGRRLLESEQLLAASGLPYTIIRFAGIYGPGRTRLLDQALAGRLTAAAPLQYSNRIHRDDCVACLAHLIARERSGAEVENCYNGVDSAPVPLAEVSQWLLDYLGCAPVQTEAPSDRGGNKRCSNRRLLASGYQLRYPDYRAGYQALIEDYAPARLVRAQRL